MCVFCKMFLARVYYLPCWVRLNSYFVFKRSPYVDVFIVSSAKLINVITSMFSFLPLIFTEASLEFFYRLFWSFLLLSWLLVMLFCCLSYLIWVSKLFMFFHIDPALLCCLLHLCHYGYMDLWILIFLWCFVRNFSLFVVNVARSFG